MAQDMLHTELYGYTYMAIQRHIVALGTLYASISVALGW